MIYRYNILSSEIDNWLINGKIFQLIDISEENCMNIYSIVSQWIPASKLLNRLDELKNDIPVVLCCQTGENSFFVMNILHNQYNKTNIYSLKSGIYGWESLKIKLK
jgi:rhodanese-related sulfurtransferase